MRALFNILLSFLLKRIRSSLSISSSAIFTSLTWGVYDHQDQRNALLLRDRNPHRPSKELVTLDEVKVWVGEESSTSVLPSQYDNIMVEHFERETLPEVPPEV